MYYNGRDMGLREYMNNINDINKDSIYYNEGFCNIVLDYLSSCDPLKQDCEFLKENGYCISDFLDEEIVGDIETYLRELNLVQYL